MLNVPGSIARHVVRQQSKGGCRHGADIEVMREAGFAGSGRHRRRRATRILCQLPPARAIPDAISGICWRAPPTMRIGDESTAYEDSNASRTGLRSGST